MEYNPGDNEYYSKVALMVHKPGLEGKVVKKAKLNRFNKINYESNKKMRLSIN